MERTRKCSEANDLKRRSLEKVAPQLWTNSLFRLNDLGDGQKLENQKSAVEHPTSEWEKKGLEKNEIHLGGNRLSFGEEGRRPAKVVGIKLHLVSQRLWGTYWRFTLE